MADEIELVPYDADWPRRFEEEARRLRPLFPGDLLIDLHHVGSTAIPGLTAKPIIDILAVVRDLAAARETRVSPLSEAGYAFWADNPARDRLFFVKGLPPTARARTHHLHIMEPGAGVRRHLLFRDHLRDHPREAARYAALKEELAHRFREDREAYTQAKTAYVDGVVARGAQ